MEKRAYTAHESHFGSRWPTKEAKSTVGIREQAIKIEMETLFFKLLVTMMANGSAKPQTRMGFFWNSPSTQRLRLLCFLKLSKFKTLPPQQTMQLLVVTVDGRHDGIGQ